MHLTEILDPQAVRALSNMTSKKRLMQELGEIASGVYGLTLGPTVDALQEREALSPTGVGHGVALPHARIEGLSAVSGVFVRLDKGMEFEAVDRQKVDLIFCLFAPIDSGVSHLKALALVSRTLRNEDVCRKLRSNDDTSTIYAILTEGQRTQAA